MKTKKALRLLNSVESILKLGIELQNKQSNKVVPEYKKSNTFSEAFDKVKKEDPIFKNAYEEINKTINEKCIQNKTKHFWPIPDIEDVKEDIKTYILETGERLYLNDSQTEWNAKILEALSDKGLIVKRPV